MAGSSYGNIFKVTTWGESHGKGLGVVVDGVPAGLELCEEDIQIFLNRRKPGQSSSLPHARRMMRLKFSPVCLRERLQAHLFLWLYGIKIRNQRITVRLLRTIVRGMLTLL